MINLNLFHQKPFQCGPASLKMVMDYYGVSTSEDELAKAAGFTVENGTTIEGMIKAAKQFGFNVFSKEKSSLSDLKYLTDNNIPVIVRWFFHDWGHYSVVVDIDEKKIILMDSMLRKVLIYERKRQLPLDKFMHIWFDFEGQVIKEPEDIIIRLMLVLVPKDKKIPIKKSLGLKKER